MQIKYYSLYYAPYCIFSTLIPLSAQNSSVFVFFLSLPLDGIHIQFIFTVPEMDYKYDWRKSPNRQQNDCR